MTSARTRPGPKLGAGPVASRSFPRTPGPRGRRRVSGAGGASGGRPRGAGGLAGRRWADPDWPGVNNGAQPPPRNLRDGIHSPGRDPAMPAGFCVTAELDLRLLAALNFLRSFRGELSRCARAGFGIAGERRGSPVKAALLKDRTTDNRSTLLERDLWGQGVHWRTTRTVAPIALGPSLPEFKLGKRR